MQHYYVFFQPIFPGLYYLSVTLAVSSFLQVKPTTSQPFFCDNEGFISFPSAAVFYDLQYPFVFLIFIFLIL